MHQRIEIDSLLDPEISVGVKAFPLDFSTLSLELLAAIREAHVTAPPPELSDDVERQDYDLPGRKGVTVRVHRPVGIAGALPCIYWMHGGGFVMGTNRSDDARFDRWCTLFGCVGISVEYRLAPEWAYPGPLDDCHAGLSWAHDNADKLGIDVSRVGVGGQSAGGGLAAALSLLARDRNEPPIAFQLLVYPMIDDRMRTVSSQWGDVIWPPSANRFGWNCYLGESYGSDDVTYLGAPARADDLAGLPPTFIAVGSLDGFADEDIEYAVRLRHAGVPTDLHVYTGAPHGFDVVVPGAAVSQLMRCDMEDWLTRTLTGPAPQSARWSREPA
jgi:acetyl esterase/lipase